MAAARKSQTGKKKTTSKTQTNQRTSGSKSNKKTTTQKGKTTTAGRAPKTKASTKHVEQEPVYGFVLWKEIALILVFVFLVILVIAGVSEKESTLFFVANVCQKWFGPYFVYVSLLALVCLGYASLNYGKPGFWIRIFSFPCYLVALCGLMELITQKGGLVGHAIETAIESVFGPGGAYLFFAALFVIGTILLTGQSAIMILRNHTQKAYKAMQEEQEVRKGQKKIRDKKRELEKQQKRTQLLKEQQEELEALEAEYEEEVQRERVYLEAVSKREFSNIVMMPEKQPIQPEPELADNSLQDDSNVRYSYEPDYYGEKELLVGQRDVRTVRELKQLEYEEADDSDLVSEQETGMTARTTYRGQDFVIDSDEDGYTDIPDPEFGQTAFCETDKKESDDTQYFENDWERAEELEEDIYDEYSGEMKAYETKPEDEAGVVLENESYEPVSGMEAEDEMTAATQENQIEDAIVINQDMQKEESIYKQELPPDSFADPASYKRTYSNTSKEEQTRENLTKTVVTGSGKVITVELDGLPGERKLPKESKYKKEAQNEESLVEISDYIEPKEYEFPPMSLLKRGNNGTTSKEETSRQLKETARKLQQTLQNFGVGVSISNISCGPSVTRYELQPEQGVKVSKIVSLTDDIKLNLAAEDIRMEAPIPGKAAIGIEVPNKEKQSVMLRDLLESEEFKKHASKIVFATGKDIAGNLILADIAKMPHLLIAGATGSGKSVCINTIIMSILYKAKPSEVKLIMIDPKVVELSIYNGIPHLLIPVVTDPKKAAAALNWAVTEMTDRYQKFAQFRVRDMKGYNEKVEQAIKDGAEGADAPKKMPQIVVIVDELADLMMVAPGDVEEAICRLAQMARAAGIHLVIATQRPSVNVITGLIKANVPSRIAFSVASGTDSRTIIDMNGAEKLLGKGDMLFYPSGYPKPLRVQGCFVSDEEVQEVVKCLSEQKNVIGGEQNHEIALDKTNQTKGNDASEQDIYFEQAALTVIEKEKASIGMLQRAFKIGFNRAARIMDQLAEAGIVSEEEGTKPRKVLMTLEEFKNR